MNTRTSLLALALTVALGSLAALAHDHETPAPEAASPAETVSAPDQIGFFPTAEEFYPLSTDPLTGERLDEVSTVVMLDHQGRAIWFASEDSLAKFEADPAAGIKLLDAAIIAEQSPAYPLSACPVSDEDLGAQSAGPQVIIDNYLVKLCCGGCKAKVHEQADALVAELETYWRSAWETPEAEAAVEAVAAESAAN